ncbi:permease prefix domain 2-containing transporter [Caulobacter sp. 1776]|uniref:permease prefix domain 2-containing transporter n=1 Tax=Caulobacter sp. 1776 TaxID=3156420 RepID=UPI003395F1DE
MDDRSLTRLYWKWMKERRSSSSEPFILESRPLTLEDLKQMEDNGESRFADPIVKAAPNFLTRLAVTAKSMTITVQVTDDLTGIEFLLAAMRNSPPKAPRVGWWILALTCPKDSLDYVVGDLEEDFPRYAAERGLAAAHWWFWIQILKSLAHFVIRAVSRLGGVFDFVKKLIS